MKNNLVLFSIIVLSYTVSNAQSNQSAAKPKPTKSETQSWISKNIASHPFISEDGNIKNEYTTSFDEISIIIKNKSTYNGKINNWTTKMVITDIDSIYWQEKKYFSNFKKQQNAII